MYANGDIHPMTEMFEGAIMTTETQYHDDEVRTNADRNKNLLMRTGETPVEGAIMSTETNTVARRS